MITVENLVKTYKRRVSKPKKYEKIVAVDNINLKIEDGEVLGLIGPNGAGKTTTLKILSTLVIPDSGKVTIDGYDVIKDANAVRKRIGLLTGEFTRSLYWRLSGFENLRFFAKIKGIWRPDEKINELLEVFHLSDYKNELIMKYSTGMKHKLALAVGLINDPEILFLDEPLTGIDPVTSYEIKNFIKNKLKNKTIIWASHNLYEIEEMCDKVALINNGKVVLYGDPKELKKNYWDHTKILITTDKANEFGSFPNVEIKEDTVKITTDNVNNTIREIVEFGKQKNIEIIDIQTLRPTLEEIFVEGIKK